MIMFNVPYIVNLIAWAEMCKDLPSEALIQQGA